MKNQRRKTARKGFSLIELLLVLAILATLATIVGMNFSGVSEKSKKTTANSQITMLNTAIERFEIEHGRLPTEDEGLEALYTNPGSDELENWSRLLKKPVPLDPWGSEYVYRQPGSSDNDYDLFSMGKDKQEGTEDDVPNLEEVAN